MLGLQLWGAFLLCAAVICISGARLSQAADVIAEKTKLGRGWAGLILLAIVTSLPELVTGISAVGFLQAPDLAVGDALGSCVFNLSILIMLDLFHPEKSIYVRAGKAHLISAGFGIVLLALVAQAALAANSLINFPVYHIGASSLIIAAIYMLAVRSVFKYERRQFAYYISDMACQYEHISLIKARIQYIGAALAVVLAGIALVLISGKLVVFHGLHQSFFGTFFLAAATSLPEVVVTLSALRIGALDMAISNLLGSNLFDVLILAIDDAVYLPGPILTHVSTGHVLTCATAILMNGVFVIGLITQAKRRIAGKLTWVSLVLLWLYLANGLLAFQYKVH